MHKYYRYKTLEGDTWDSIALDFYNEETCADLIIKANPKYCSIIVFSEGVELKIPLIEKPKTNNLPPWR